MQMKLTCGDRRYDKHIMNYELDMALIIPQWKAVFLIKPFMKSDLYYYLRYLLKHVNSAVNEKVNNVHLIIIIHLTTSLSLFTVLFIWRNNTFKAAKQTT